MIQLSILKISEYGAWTLTLGSDREHELQMLQASLYKKVQKLFSERNCLVFYNRADEFFAVSNGLTLKDHVQIQTVLEKSFDIRITISIGHAKSPFEANLSAYKGRKTKTVLSKEHNIFGFLSDNLNSKVSIMHLDVDNLTLRDQTSSPYEISSIIFELYAKMSKFFLEKKSLTFFMGGDNFMIVATDDDDDDVKKSAQSFIDTIKNDNGISLNCGIGHAHTGREAAKLATKSLDTIRKIRDSGKEKCQVYELSC